MIASTPSATTSGNDATPLSTRSTMIAASMSAAATTPAAKPIRRALYPGSTGVASDAGTVTVSAIPDLTCTPSQCLPDVPVTGITILTILVCARFLAHVFVRPKEGPVSGYNERQARPTHRAFAAGDYRSDRSAYGQSPPQTRGPSTHSRVKRSRYPR